jgi:P4 family phage/plasmid primase-like protien
MNDKKKPQEAATDPFKLGRNYVWKHETDSQKRKTLRFYRSEWWRWAEGRYKVVSREYLSAELTMAIKREVDATQIMDGHGNAYKVTGGIVSNVLNAMEAMLILEEGKDQPFMIESEQQTEFIALKNGLLSVDQLGSDRTYLQPHTPNWFSPVALPYEFDKNAQAPLWLQFLNEVLEGDAERIALLQEWFGLCLVPDTTFHTFLVLEGQGANGKSVVLDLLGALLGNENVSHVPLSAFGERFQLTPTLGKLANIAPDMDERERPNIGVLKQFVGGDRMYFDRKNIPGLQAKPTARLVMATNHRPTLTDTSEGLWRRMLLLPFRVTILPDQRDRELSQKLRGELPGIFNWALEGLERLRRQGRFTKSSITAQAVEEYRHESNPVGMFLKEYCELSPTVAFPADELFGAYQQFCQLNGYPSVDASAFGKELKKAFPSVRRRKRTVNRRRAYVYEGLVCRYPGNAVEEDALQEGGEIAA